MVVGALGFDLKQVPSCFGACLPSVGLVRPAPWPPPSRSSPVFALFFVGCLWPRPWPPPCSSPTFSRVPSIFVSTSLLSAVALGEKELCDITVIFRSVPVVLCFCFSFS
jgi:hypothetical protein